AVGYLGSDKGRVMPGQLITGGPYRFIRHPLYLANFLIISGLLLYLGDPLILMVVILTGYIFCYYHFAAYEERMLDHYPGYHDYKRRVHPILPLSIYRRSRGEFRWRNCLTDLPATLYAVSVVLAGIWI
ncbi:MAG: hypothetical protein DRN12_05190, partial [Thermoplasmata archaeon]